jgi:hypothetical protein
MNFVNWLAGPILIAALALSGCGDDGEIDTSKLEDSFSATSAASKDAADDIVSALESEDYAKAGAALKRLAARANLTPAQKEAIADVMSQIGEKATQIAKDAVKEGEKAIEDIKKRLGQ